MVNKKEKEPVTKDTKQLIDRLTKEAQKAEKVAEKILFVSKLKQFGMAIGGALLFFGFLLYAILGLIVIDAFPILIPVNYKFLVCVVLALLGSLHVLGGIVLIAG